MKEQKTAPDPTTIIQGTCILATLTTPKAKETRTENLYLEKVS